MKQAFVDVDVQRDFCEEGGALFVKGSPNDRFRTLTKIAVERRIPILGSVDSHAYDAWEFASNERKGPNGEDPRFPDHCVKGTEGWLKVKGTLPQRFRFVPNVSALDEHVIDDLAREIASGATEGAYFEKEVYSLFANPIAERTLRAILSALGGSVELVVYGVATDYCVRAAALGLRERGLATALVTNAIAGITPEGTDAALSEMRAAGVRMTDLASVIG